MTAVFTISDWNLLAFRGPAGLELHKPLRPPLIFAYFSTIHKVIFVLSGFNDIEQKFNPFYSLINYTFSTKYKIKQSIHSKTNTKKIYLEFITRFLKPSLKANEAQLDTKYSIKYHSWQFFNSKFCMCIHNSTKVEMKKKLHHLTFIGALRDPAGPRRVTYFRQSPY